MWHREVQLAEGDTIWHPINAHFITRPPMQSSGYTELKLRVREVHHAGLYSRHIQLSENTNEPLPPKVVPIDQNLGSGSWTVS